MTSRPPGLLTRDDLLAIEPVRPTHRIRYGAHPDQTVDVHLPDRAAHVHVPERTTDDRPPEPTPDDHPLERNAGTGSEPFPVALLLHGGCWRAAVGRGYFGAFAEALCANGIAAWNVEYRRVGSGGGWPPTFEDVARAADLVSEHASAMGLDPDRVVAVGHSAGGHLAAWLAARVHLPAGAPGAAEAPLRLRGVLALAGIPDLLEAHRRGVCGTAVRELLGGDPGAADAAGILARASPAELPPTAAPQVHMVGEHDAIVPPDYVQASVGRMRARGQRARVRILEGCGHFEPAVARTPPWPEVLGAIDALAEGRMAAAP